MSRESGAEQPQKTVAELLAEHGARVDDKPRRRRRAPEDEEDEPPNGSRRRPNLSDTAPQAIIDRVAADGGTPPPANRRAAGGGRRARPPQDRQPPPPNQPPVPAQAMPPQHSMPLRRPPRGEEPPPPDDFAPPAPGPGGPAGPGTRRSMPPARDRGPRQPGPQDTRGPMPPARTRAGMPPVPPPPHSGAFSARLDGVNGAAPDRLGPPEPGPGQMASGGFPVPPEAGPGAGQMASGGFPVPPEAGPGPGPGQMSSGGFPVPPEVGRGPGPGQMASGGFPVPPEAGPMNSGAFPAPPRRPRRPPRVPLQPEPDPHTEQFPAVADPGDAPVAVNGSLLAGPHAPNRPDAPPGLAGWRERRLQAQMDDTEIGGLPLMPDPHAPGEDEPPAGLATGRFAPATFAAGRPAAVEDAPPRPDELRGDLHADERFDEGVLDEGVLDEGDLEEEYDYEDDEPDQAEVVDEPEPSPGRQWLAMAGQLAGGVLGGALVWLAFNWLWVKLPAAALIAALVVVVGLVWIVRKIRRADDLQTTVLALLVGLVVTVSPAALLLVSR